MRDSEQVRQHSQAAPQKSKNSTPIKKYIPASIIICKHHARLHSLMSVTDGPPVTSSKAIPGVVHVLVEVCLPIIIIAIARRYPYTPYSPWWSEVWTVTLPSVLTPNLPRLSGEEAVCPCACLKTSRHYRWHRPPPLKRRGGRMPLRVLRCNPPPLKRRGEYLFRGTNVTEHPR